ncbi:MAG TPA: recombinase RecA [Acidobacteriaceae bacterium]|nr:recombinase RecA [Acidobacteriaceae bacterium]
MPAGRFLRAQIEAVLAEKIPSALSPQPQVQRTLTPTNIEEVDELLQGGMPAGAISEIVGPESSGRTALALAFLAGITRTERVCAWIDVSDTLHPESAAAIGVNLSRMLWVRCGASSSRSHPGSCQRELVFPEKFTTPPLPIRGLHGGGFGPHPRTEGKGLPAAIGDLLVSPGAVCVQPAGAEANPGAGTKRQAPGQEPVRSRKESFSAGKPWVRLDQALRVTDLLLQAGGFASVVLDMGSIEAEHALRVPLATWFRFRAAAERTQTNFLLLTQHPCAKNSAGLVLRLEQGNPLTGNLTIFTGLEHRAELDRRRFPTSSADIFSMRKPPQSIRTAAWQSQTSWTGRS